MTSTLLTILLGALGSVLAAELLGWCLPLAEKIVRLAATRLPVSNRQRYLDEWLGDMDVMRRRGGVSLLLWAMALYLVAPRVANALQSSKPKQVTKHHRPSFDEVELVTSLGMEIISSSPKAKLGDRLILHPVLKPVVLPLLTIIFWTFARINRSFCASFMETVRDAHAHRMTKR
jgi:hypothetical protein